MPDKDDHVNQANHNREFWESYDLDTTTYIDWVVVGIFYECLHWIEAYLSTHSEHSGGHPDRLRGIRRHTADIGTIRTDYELIKVESENARYLCYKHTPADIRDDLIPLLEGIKSQIEVLL